MRPCKFLLVIRFFFSYIHHFSLRGCLNSICFSVKHIQLHVNAYMYALVIFPMLVIADWSYVMMPWEDIVVRFLFFLVGMCGFEQSELVWSWLRSSVVCSGNKSSAEVCCAYIWLLFCYVCRKKINIVYNIIKQLMSDFLSL